MYYHVTFTINENVNAETVVKARNAKKAEEELNNYFNKTGMLIEIIDIRESKYLNEQ